MIMDQKPSPLLGQTIGHLAVLEELPRQNRSRVFRCSCAACGRMDVIKTSSTIYSYRSHHKIMHCGCLTAQERQHRISAQLEKPIEWDGQLHITSQEFFENLEKMERGLHRKSQGEDPPALANQELASTIDDLLKKCLYRQP